MASEMKPTAHQMTLFKSAPREYVNLSIDPPVVAAYYIDEGFHKTWVIRSKTKFQDFDGKDGLKFTISDYRFLLPHVEAVSSNELVDSFGDTGAAVDLILGQDFINIYSVLFYKRNNDGLQLSKSCINRTIWPEKLTSRLDFYTAFHLNHCKGGIAAYTNICSPFNIWRPYKPSYWDPREDMGLSAMTLAMRVATQMPISEAAPAIHLITSDEYTCERFSPFLEIRYDDLEASNDFKNLKVLPMKRNIMAFLEYRKRYADYNDLNELSCVYIDIHGVTENMEYAKDLARLGAEMSQLHFKGELPSQPPDQQYYHFDSHIDVFTISKTSTNRTLKRILQAYQEHKNIPMKEEITLNDTSTNKTPTPKAYLENSIIHNKAPIINRSPQGSPTQRKTFTIDSPPAKKTPTNNEFIVQPANPYPENLNQVKQNNPLFSEILAILHRVKTGKVISTEKDVIICEVNSKLQEIMSKERDNASQAVNRQRQNCDIIMAGAYRQSDESIEIVKKAARLQGYIEGFFDRNNDHQAIQSRTENLTQEPVDQTSNNTVDRVSTGPTLKESAVKSPTITTTPIVTADTAMSDANRRYKCHQLAIEKPKLERKLLAKEEASNEKISSIKCQFSKLGKVGDMLHAKVQDGTLKVNHIAKYQDGMENLSNSSESVRDIEIDLVVESSMKTRSNCIDEIHKKSIETRWDHMTENKHDIGPVDDFKIITKQKTAPIIDFPAKKKLALSNRYSDINVYSCSPPLMHSKEVFSLESNGGVPEVRTIDSPKHVTFKDNEGTVLLHTADHAPTPEPPTDKINPKQRAEMTNVSGEGVEKSLERPIITLEQALEASPYLRKTLSMLFYSIGVKVDILKDGIGLRCVRAA